MILDHFSDPTRSLISYLIACPETREAALIDPRSESLETYMATLSNRGLRLARVLCTSDTKGCNDAIHQLSNGQIRAEIFPELMESAPCALSSRITDEFAGATLSPHGHPIAVGKLRIRAVPSGSGFDYRVGSYTFTADRLLIGENQSAPHDPAEAVTSRAAGCGKVQNLRTTRENIAIEQLLLEDLHTSLIEDAFSPKETLVVRAYIELLEEREFAHPSAADLAAKLGNIDRSVIHVLVHSIRWKQIDFERLPLVLAGQASKWLRDLKTEPEFTSHEKEFLCAYLPLVSSNGSPPSGPDVAKELGPHRSIQWVRKRAFTIRRKQREFDQPLLILARNKPETQPSMQTITLSPRRDSFILDQLPIA